MKKFDFKILKCAGSDLSRAVLTCLEYLQDKEGVYGCDLHGELFNSDQYYIYYSDAVKALDEVGMWDCIECVMTYHVENFGEFEPKNVNPYFFANMMIYLIGEALLIHSEHLNHECWDRRLTNEDLEIIEDEIQSYLELLSADLSNIAFGK